MIKGTLEGNREEIELVRKLNSNTYPKFWDILNIKYNTFTYAVRCTSKKFSKISKQKVSPKSDVFIISTKEEVTLDNNYLDENMLEQQNINYTLIMDSGISVKEKSSKSYTIQKMTIQTFYTIFGNYELGCAIEYYTGKNDTNKNKILETSWNTNKISIIQKIHSLAKEYKYPNDLQLDNDQNIKRTAIKLTQYIIDNNSTISDYIFKGIGAFENPYYALFLYKGEQMYPNNIPKNYSITTGSGRSKGDYTVVIKP